ncbi:MAG: putative membrane protein YczE [Verrucomicrobiales bacterium]|jgi:uncharacterized membrane protein YczE
MNFKWRLTSSVENKKAAARHSAEWFVGISRHGVLAAERAAQGPRAQATYRSALSLFAGSIFIGLGVSLFVHGHLGVPAYDVMLTALRDLLGVSLGQASWIFTGFLFLVASLLGHRPRMSGLFYVLSNGIAVDVWMRLIRDPEPLAVRMLFVLLGTLAIAAGVALVIHAGLTGGAIELLMNAGSDRGLDPFQVRMAIEVLIVLVGVALGGDLGFATVFFVLTMSPALKAGQQALADHRAGRTARLAA